MFRSTWIRLNPPGIVLFSVLTLALAAGSLAVPQAARAERVILGVEELFVSGCWDSQCSTHLLPLPCSQCLGFYGPGDDETAGLQVVRLADDGVFLAGSLKTGTVQGNASYPYACTNAWTLKTDFLGQVLWSTCVPGDAGVSSYVGDLIVIPGEGCVLAQKRGYGHHGCLAEAMMLDEQGAIVWRVSLGDDQNVFLPYDNLIWADQRSDGSLKVYWPADNDMQWAVLDTSGNIIDEGLDADLAVNIKDNDPVLTAESSQHLAVASCSPAAITLLIDELPTPVELDVMLEGPVKVTINGQEIVFTDAQPFINSDGRVMVPVRTVLERMGVEVEWDEEAQQAKLAMNGNEVIFTIGSSTYTINGISHTMDTAPIIEQGRTLFPVRFAVEAFNATVNWDQNTVAIETNSAQ